MLHPHPFLSLAIAFDAMNGGAALQGFHTNVTGLAFSSKGDLATVTEDQVLKVFSTQDLSAKTIPSQRTILSRPPIDVAFASPSEIYILVEVSLKFTISTHGLSIPEERSTMMVLGRPLDRVLIWVKGLSNTSSLFRSTLVDCCSQF